MSLVLGLILGLCGIALAVMARLSALSRSTVAPQRLPFVDMAAPRSGWVAAHQAFSFPIGSPSEKGTPPDPGVASVIAQIYLGAEVPSVRQLTQPEPSHLPIDRLFKRNDPYFSWLTRWLSPQPVINAAHDFSMAWRYFWGVERRLLLEAHGDEWGALVMEVYRLRQAYGHDDAFELASRALLETVALLRMSQGLALPLEQLNEEHLLQWDERLLFQGLLTAKRFRLRKQQLLRLGSYQASNPGMGAINLACALESGMALSRKDVILPAKKAVGSSSAITSAWPVKRYSKQG